MPTLSGVYLDGMSVVHALRDRTRDAWQQRFLRSSYTRHDEADDYSHLNRRKTRGEMVRISAAVVGIEMCYAAETAFVSPALLEIGVRHLHMTLVWCLSATIGLFLGPLLGSLSDRCRSRFGRRRPFVAILSLGILIGLLLVPNGRFLGETLGDSSDSRPWGVALTVAGTVLLDLDADACQSPARSYLLDVTVTEDHALGLSTFTVMAGLGGSLGYLMGGVDWDATGVGSLFGGHVRAVFTFVLIVFLICVVTTLRSFREMPLDVIQELQESRRRVETSEDPTPVYGSTDVVAVQEDDEDKIVPPMQQKITDAEGTAPSYDLGLTLRQLILSAVHMPASLAVLCLTNLFCWMSLVCYSLYFTDFVGEAVFGGDPRAPEGSVPRDTYERGVRFGCLAMSLYSLSCSVYSLTIESLVIRFGAKWVYVGGQLVYCCGMVVLAITRNRLFSILMSSTAGVMYATLFTVPYLLVARYHSADVSFSCGDHGQVRGLGTDVAIVGSMVFLAQLLLSACMGSVINAAGSTVVVVGAAALLSFCGAISAVKVTYLDL